MISWEKYFLELAKVTALRSTCMHDKVGVIIVSTDNRVIATGYKGAPSSVHSCLNTGKCRLLQLKQLSSSNCIAVGAEQNAIMQIGKNNCVGASMFIYGHDSLDILSIGNIINSGIKVIYLQKNNDTSVVRVLAEDYINMLNALQVEN